MTKTILTLALVSLLSGCGGFTPRNADITPNFSLPKELQDCKFYYLRDNAGNDFKIVRCPNSSVSMQYKHGKHLIHTLTVE